MLAVEVWSGEVSDEKLAAVRVRTGIGHRENSWLGVFQRVVNFIGEFVTGAAGAGAGWVATLDHEVGDDAVKGDAIVIAAFCKVEEIGASDWDLGGEKPSIDIACRGVNCDFNIGHECEQILDWRVLQLNRGCRAG